MSELDDALKLANRVLDKPYIDPDGDICMLARQLLLQTERLAHVQPQQEPVGEIYDFNIGTGLPVARFNKEWSSSLTVDGLPYSLYSSQPVLLAEIERLKQDKQTAEMLAVAALDEAERLKHQLELAEHDSVSQSQLYAEYQEEWQRERGELRAKLEAADQAAERAYLQGRMDARSEKT